MQRRLYSLLLHAVLPLAAARLWWRRRRNPQQPDSLRQRLAIALPPRRDAPLWLHAASVGELRALAALLRQMGGAAGPVLITVGTPTGLALARQMFGEAGHAVQLAPWDLPGAVRRFIAAIGPRALVLVECELWPNLLAAASSQQVPVALLSARLSARSLARYRRFAAAMMRQAVRSIGVIGCQTEVDRQRFIALGAAAEQVHVIGNLKFDAAVDARLAEQGRELRARWAPQRALWVAGSTHAGEEEVLLEAQRRLRAAARAASMPPPLLAFAPRHPERFNAVARWLQGQDLASARLGEAITTSDAANPAAAAPATAEAALEVLLIDRMGVLQPWYAAADATFVGGSLVPVGGHNLLEPAALARPVLCGPHTFNAPEVTRALCASGGARVVKDADELFAQLSAWLADATLAAAAGASAAAAVEQGQGAAQRALQLIRESAWSAPSATG